MFAPAGHPVAAAVAAVHAELDDLAETALFGLSDAELAVQAERVHRLGSKVAALELRMVAESSERGLDTKATMVRTTHQTPPVAHRRLHLARALTGHDRLRCAFGRGEVSEAQAEVIVRALEAIPTDHDGIDAGTVARAEAALITLAGEHHAKELTRLGDKILEVVAPDVVDDLAGQALQRAHDKALQTCRFTMTDDGHGRCYLRGQVPSSVGAILRRNLLGLAAPKHVRATGTGEQCGIIAKPGPERMGRALCEYVERYPTDRLPNAGGVQARATVTIDHDQLLGALGASGVATLNNVPIPAGVARRLACEAGILPAVLDGQSKPLDLGRSTRFHTTTQRLALELRDKTCTAEGCDWPAYLCHAHHDTLWSRGGGTSVVDGRLLCPHHHGLAHHPRWEMRKTKHGRVIFLRR